MSTIALGYILKLNISETGPLEIEAWFQSTTNRIGNGLQEIKWSRGRWRHVTLKGQTRDANTHRAQYLENSWKWYFTTIANYFRVCCEAVRVGYPSDSLASCPVTYTPLKGTFSWRQFCRWQYGSISIRLAVVASQICEISDHTKFRENSNLLQLRSSNRPRYQSKAHATS